MEHPGFKTLPTHIAMIMDGNGRWAKKRLLPRTAGHKVGLDTFVEMVDACSDLGIPYMTVYAFSSENWNREKTEVDALMSLMESGIRRYTPEMHRKNIRLHLMGDLSRFPEKERTSLLACREELSQNTGMTLSICLSYGGRQEILHAVNELLAEGKKEVTAEELEQHLYSAGLPDPDLIIRTSGEYRISNFLLWQSAYAEYYFTDVYWPDFKKEELYKALSSFETRKRRFGK